jgi:hypothetical protein
MKPFGVMDVAHPADQEVLEFAACMKLLGTWHDDNARTWSTSDNGNQRRPHDRRMRGTNGNKAEANPER